MKYSLRLALFLVLAFTAASTFAAPLYHLTDMGLLPSTTYALPLEINSSGHVAGRANETNHRAFLWTPGGGMQGLGVLPGDVSSVANGISNTDQVVGASYPTANPTNGHAFLWTSGGGMQNLGDLPGGADYSEAQAINSSGQVVGFSGAAAGEHAFLWTSGGGMVDLGVLPGATSSQAYDINDSGVVVGQSGSHAFRWTSGGGMQAIGNSGDFARDINSSGQIVGHNGVVPAFGDPFLWTTADGRRNLNTLLDAASSSWVLQSAFAINDAGQIAGTAPGQGGTHAVLLTLVPEPSTVALAACGLVLLTGYAVQRRKSTG